MIQSLVVVALPILFAMLAGTVNAASCNTTSPCPASAPCCSEFGFCGSGYFCLGGCNPFASRSFDSCKPSPICQDTTYTFTDQSRILSNSTLFDGNASAYDWVVNQGSVINSDGDLGLILTQANGGTRLSSTHYVHYGTITAKLKTSRWAGVVTAFITMSDVKDEIDWEFPGNGITQGQSNLFWQGVIPTSKTDGVTHGNLTDTFSNYHEYTINWQSDTLQFSIDGSVVRTINKAQTIDSAGVPHYPTTPSRIELSLWPAGIPSSPKGTVEWAGGMINWDDPDYKSAGHFYARINSVSIKCADPQKPPADSNITSYIYAGNMSNHNIPTILFSNRTTLLKGSAGRLAVPLQGGMGGMVLTVGLGLVLGLNALLL